MRLFQPTCREAGVITCIQFWKARPVKFGRVNKTSKFRRYFWQLSSLIANISGKDRHIENRRKTRSTTTPFTLSEKKLGELWSTNNRDPAVHIDPPKWFFSGDYISALKECCPFKFLHVLDYPDYLAHPHRGQGSPKKILIVKILYLA